MNVKVRFVAVRPTRPAAVWTFLVLVCAVVTAIFLEGPPAPLGADSDPLEFSALRAKVHVDRIARVPRPIGSAAQADVIQYIKEQLASVGLAPEEQVTTVVRTHQRPTARAARVRNIVARLPGTDSSKAILLVTHHDSVPNAPGAGDAGAGVATLLETARALTAGPALENDVIFLFTDGEELGLLGAKAFLDEHPWAEGVGLVLNFEGRGSRGPVFLFETSAENGWLMSEVAKAAPHVISTSLMNEVYTRMPNDTDLSLFKNLGYPCLNFAFLGGHTRYHSARDVPANLSDATLQHMGSYALSLTRHFGALDISKATAPDATYFNPVGSVFVHHPAAWVLPLTFVAVVVLVAVIGLALVLGKITWGALILGALTLGVVAAGMAAPLFYFGGDVIDYYGVYIHHRSVYFLVGLVCVALGLFTGVYALLGLVVPVTSLALGSLCWWAALGAISAVLAPGVAHLFVWPLLFGVLSAVLLLFKRDANYLTLPWAAPLALLGVPGLLFLAPMIHQFLVAMTVARMDMVIVLTTLTFGLLLPQLHTVYRRYRWRFPVACLAIGGGVIALLHVGAGYNAVYPDVDHVVYGWDADSKEASWLSLDDEPDEWTRQFFTADRTVSEETKFFPSAGRPFMIDKAVEADLTPPLVEVIGQEAQAGTRTIHLLLRSTRGAQVLALYPEREDAILSMSVDGTTLPPPAFSRLHVSGLPEEGIEVSLEVSASEPFELIVIDESYGLPDVPFEERPDTIIPFPHGGALFSDATLVRKRYTFETVDSILSLL